MHEGWWEGCNDEVRLRKIRLCSFSNKYLLVSFYK